jgi:hypothetical protein
MEILCQVFDHPITWVAVGTQEGVVVTYAVQTLTDAVLTQALLFVAGCEHFNGAFFGLDVLLDFATGSAFRVNFLGC